MKSEATPGREELRLAELFWRHEAEGVPALKNARDQYSFNDQSETTQAKWLGYARVARAAKCSCGPMCQDLGKLGGCQYLRPERATLRALVDAVWQHATESKSVPSTDTADKLIDSALPSGTGAAGPVALGEQQIFDEAKRRYEGHGRFQRVFIEGAAWGIHNRATPPVRGDREVEQRVISGREDWFLLAHELSEARDAYLNGMGQEGSAARRMRLEEILWNDKGTFIQVLQAMSLSVQPGAGER